MLTPYNPAATCEFRSLKYSQEMAVYAWLNIK